MTYDQPQDPWQSQPQFAAGPHSHQGDPGAAGPYPPPPGMPPTYGPAPGAFPPQAPAPAAGPSGWRRFAAWWRQVRPGGKVGLIVVAVFLVCGGLTTVSAIVAPPPQTPTPKPAAGAQHAGVRPNGVPTTAGTAVPGTPSALPVTSSPAAVPPTSAAAPTTPPAPVVLTRTVTETQSIAYATTRVNDSSLAAGTTKVRTHGVNGVRTLTYQVTLTNGVQTGKKLISQKTTRSPVNQVIAVGTKQASKCDPNYSGCVPIASDVDCAGGSSNGPAYVQGPVKVIGTDIYDLDSDHDGYGCED